MRTLLSFSLLLVGVAQSQVISGDVVGTIVDKTGAGVPNAKVRALNVNTGANSRPQPTEQVNTIRVTCLWHL